jgi:hypothetical protein
MRTRLPRYKRSAHLPVLLGPLFFLFALAFSRAHWAGKFPSILHHFSTSSPESCCILTVDRTESILWMYSDSFL